MTYEDDIALLAEDIERWAGLDARIIDAVKQLMKLHQAEVDALAFEAKELSGLLVRATTTAERQRIETAHHNQQVRWIHSDGMGW